MERVTSQKREYGTQLEVFGAYLRSLSPPLRAYSVEPAPKQTSARLRILVNDMPDVGKRKAVSLAIASGCGALLVHEEHRMCDSLRGYNR